MYTKEKQFARSKEALTVFVTAKLVAEKYTI